jgi:hypothetical protein
MRSARLSSLRETEVDRQGASKFEKGGETKMLDTMRPSGSSEERAESFPLREGKKTLSQAEDGTMSKTRALVYVVDDDASVRGRWEV